MREIIRKTLRFDRTDLTIAESIYRPNLELRVYERRGIEKDLEWLGHPLARPRAHRKPTATTNSKTTLPEVGTLLIDGGRMDVTKKSGIVAAHLELGVVTAVEEREITIQVRRSMLQSHASAPCSRSARHALST